MCAILDANVSSEVFGHNRPQAGKGFFDWINSGSGRLVVGGKLLDELKRSSEGFRTWAVQARLAGRMTEENKREVGTRTAELQRGGEYKSDDLHILALAQVSEVRLLYSNDGDLQQDFGNKRLIDNPRGKVYSTRKNTSFTTTHKSLLGRNDLCRIAH